MQSKNSNQMSIKEFCIEKGKTPKQDGLKRDNSHRSPPEDIQWMKKMDHGSNANNENKPFDRIKDEDVTIHLTISKMKMPPPASVPPPLWVTAFWLGRSGAQERGVPSFPSPALPVQPTLSLSLPS